MPGRPANPRPPVPAALPKTGRRPDNKDRSSLQSNRETLSTYNIFSKATPFFKGRPPRRRFSGSADSKSASRRGFSGCIPRNGVRIRPLVNHGALHRARRTFMAARSAARSAFQAAYLSLAFPMFKHPLRRFFRNIEMHGNVTQGSLPLFLQVFFYFRHSGCVIQSMLLKYSICRFLCSRAGIAPE